MNKLLALLTLFLLNGLVRAADLQVPPEVERAVLLGDWKTVVKLASDVKFVSPTLRLIMGNANLALNENNESLRVFLGASLDADLVKYETWAISLPNEHRDNAIAYYFKGDALARRAKWTEAVNAFNSALKISPTHALSLNARGVCHALAGEGDHALEDFQAATDSSPMFSEAWTNRGAMYVQRSRAAPGALLAFDKALRSSPKSVLAKMGRACALFGAGNLDEAENELVACQKQPEITDIVRINLSLVRDARLSLASKRLASADKEVGVSLKLETQVRAINNNQQEINQSIKANSIHAAYNSGFSNILHDWSSVLDFGSKAASLAERPDLAKTMSLFSDTFKIAANSTNSAAAHYQNSVNAMEQQFQAGNKALMRISYIQSPGSPQANAYEHLYMPQPMKSPPGGIKMDMSRAHVDSGNWGVYVPYGILYTGTHFPELESKGRP